MPRIKFKAIDDAVQGKDSEPLASRPVRTRTTRHGHTGDLIPAFLAVGKVQPRPRARASPAKTRQATTTAVRFQKAATPQKAAIQTTAGGRSLRTNGVQTGRVQKVSTSKDSVAQQVPSTREMRQQAAGSRVKWSKIAGQTGISIIQPFAEHGEYHDVAGVDEKLVKGTPIKKSTRPLLALSGKGRVVDWPATNDKYNESYRKWLRHPLAKEFDNSRASYKEDVQAMLDKQLDIAHGTLIERLHGVNDDDNDETLKADAMLQKQMDFLHEGNQDTRIGEQVIAITTTDADGSKHKVQFTLKERAQQFKTAVAAAEEKIKRLCGEHATVISKLQQTVAVNPSQDASVSRGLDKQTAEIVELLEKEIKELGQEELQELGAEIELDKSKMRRLQELMASFR